ncbi:MAG: ferritin [Alphaproteobacteria bacterium]|nr:ferritin [Alphaproteobacteria bacterium]
MGEMAQKISKTEQENLINMLQTAYAEEWLAYYQYWVGAKVAEGIERPKIVAEFYEHAEEELKHANWLAERIIQLGAVPLLNPKEWEDYAECQYDEPINPDTKVLVEQNLIAERCAIGRYQKICEITHDKDYETFRVSRKILKEEIEHEQEMEDFKKDFAHYK